MSGRKRARADAVCGPYAVPWMRVQFGVSCAPLSKDVLTRAKAATIRRIKVNRLPLEMDAAAWEHGSAEADVASLLSADGCPLLELQVCIRACACACFM